MFYLQQQGSPQILPFACALHIAHLCLHWNWEENKFVFEVAKQKILGTRQLEVKMHCSRKFQRLKISPKNITKRKLFQKINLAIYLFITRGWKMDFLSRWRVKERKRIDYLGLLAALQLLMLLLFVFLLFLFWFFLFSPASEKKEWRFMIYIVYLWCYCLF